MRYRALCPKCGAKIGRWNFLLTVPEMRRTCRHCGCCYKANSKWEWIGDIIGGIPVAIFLLLGTSRLVDWATVLMCLAAWFGVGFLMFPFVTSFEAVEPGEDGENDDSAKGGPERPLEGER